MSEEEIRELMRLIGEIKDNLEELKLGLRAMLPRLRVIRRVPAEIADEILAEKISTATDLNETRIMYMTMMDQASRERLEELANFFRLKVDRFTTLLENAEEAHAIEPERFTTEIVENIRRKLIFWSNLRDEAERRLR